MELPANNCEFYDVSIGTMCNAGCNFCYVSAKKDGEPYKDISNTWKKWMSTYNETLVDNGTVLLTDKMFQIAIGSEGEPTTSPEF